MQTVLQVPVEFIYADLAVFALLAVWNLFILLVLSKKVYEFALKKGRSINSSIYFSRKVIHFLAGGLTAMLLPFVAHEPILPALMAFGLALATYNRINLTGGCTGFRIRKISMMWISH